MVYLRFILKNSKLLKFRIWDSTLHVTFSVAEISSKVKIKKVSEIRLKRVPKLAKELIERFWISKIWDIGSYLETKLYSKILNY